MCSTAKQPTVPFQAGSPMLIVGPTNCGKTFWVNRLLTNDMFNEPISNILYCYGVQQHLFDDMKKDPNIRPSLHFHEGLPNRDDIDNLAKNGGFQLVILDDLMEHIVRSQEMQQLFTKYCHHLNISAIFISQNIFQNGPQARTISLSCHVIVLFANKRDESQIRIFARQIYPTKWRRFIEAYEHHMNFQYSYLVVDCTPAYPRDIKVRSCIFPGETTVTYNI